MMRIGQWRAIGARRLSPLQSLVAQHAHDRARASSLSAIHRGMRRSEKVQHDDRAPRPFSRQQSPYDMGRRSHLTSRAMEGTSSSRQLHKLRKKLGRKAEEEEEEEENGRQSRRKRFINPEKSFGKKSLVYQLKHGALKDHVSTLRLREPVRPDPFHSLRTERRSMGQRSSGSERDESNRSVRSGRFPGRDRLSEPGRFVGSERSDRPDRFSKSGRSVRSEQSDRPDRFAGSERSVRSDRFARPDRFVKSERFAASERFAKSERFPRSDRYVKSEQSRQPDRFSRPERSTRSDQLAKPDGPFQFADPEQGSWRSRASGPVTETRRLRSNDDDEKKGGRDEQDETALGHKRSSMMSPTIKYTTAASQFLYGRSVVKAALDQQRRKLYNLYIYDGESRRESKDASLITRAAQRRGVPITKVPLGEQSLMDKMSMGRPHNGFILEASPLPQLPIRSLGRLEESPGKLGFHVEPDYQSKEEEAINGRDSFIARKGHMTPKPLVLLLHEIVDPGNLGGLLRTASYMGVDAVGITSRSSSTLTPVALKSAAGAAEEVSIFTVDSPVEFLEESKKAGWVTYAAVAPPDPRLARMHGHKFVSAEAVEQQNPLFHDACILVMGNEGHGLSKQIKVAADYELSIPRFVQHSCVDSLNVSVAAGLLCHAFVKAASVRSSGAESRTQRAEEVDGRDEEEKQGDMMF